MKKSILIGVMVTVFAFLPVYQVQAAVEIKSVAAVVTDTATGEVLYSKNAAALRSSASLTKLIAALVLFDHNPQMQRAISVIKSDEVGGGRFGAKPGATYFCKDIIAVSLMASTNNTTNAMIRCTDISRQEFIARMNMKVRELGGTQSNFYEPTGMDARNKITAEEYVKVLNAAVANKTIQKWMQTKKYTFTAANNKKISHTISNTNSLLGDRDLTVSGGKTGFINESKYNFATVLNNPLGQSVSVVVLGAPNRATSFAEAKKLGINAMLESVFFAKK